MIFIIPRSTSGQTIKEGQTSDCDKIVRITADTGESVPICIEGIGSKAPEGSCLPYTYYDPSTQTCKAVDEECTKDKDCDKFETSYFDYYCQKPKNSTIGKCAPTQFKSLNKEIKARKESQANNTGSLNISVRPFLFLIPVLMILFGYGLYRYSSSEKKPTKKKKETKKEERRLTNRRKDSESLEILKKKLAKGEISEEEFKRKRKLLEE